MINKRMRFHQAFYQDKKTTGAVSDGGVVYRLIQGYDSNRGINARPVVASVMLYLPHISILYYRILLYAHFGI